MGVRIRQKGGKWYVFINHQGQRKAKCIGDDKRLALQVKKQLEAKLTLGDVGLLKEERAPVLFGDYARQWLETYVQVKMKRSSGRVTRSIVLNHLLPAFESEDIRTITRSDVKAFVTRLALRVSPKHVANIVRPLHSICEHAVDEEVLDHNPVSRLGQYLPAQRFDPDHEIMPFTSAELARYLTTMGQHYPQYYPYFLCLARTGMREGEGLALHWDDLQWGSEDSDLHRFIHIRRTYDPVHNLFNTPKSGKSRRVDMSRGLRTVLVDLHHQRFDAALLKGLTTLPPVIFCTRTGRPWTRERLYPIHRRMCAEAGLRVNRIHDLRHSYATIMLYEHNAPIQYVSEQLGHSSIKITVDIYGHPRQGMNTHLADRLDAPAQLSATLAQPVLEWKSKYQ